MDKEDTEPEEDPEEGILKVRKIIRMTYMKYRSMEIILIQELKWTRQILAW